MIQVLKRSRWWVVALVLLISLIPISAFAQGSGPSDDDVNEVARQLYCPVCENIPLDTCGTAACEQWRGIIRDKLAEGWTAPAVPRTVPRAPRFGLRRPTDSPLGNGSRSRRGRHWNVPIYDRFSKPPSPPVSSRKRNQSGPVNEATRVRA